MKMKKSLIEGKDYSTVVLNYRKDKKPFWNHIRLAHLKDESGRSFLIVGMHTKVRIVFLVIHLK